MLPSLPSPFHVHTSRLFRAKARLAHCSSPLPKHKDTPRNFQKVTSHSSQAAAFMMASPASLMQLQTQAGGRRTKPIPISKSQNPSEDSLRSLSSSTSTSSRTSSPHKPAFDIVRCSRCQRSLSIDTSGPATQQGAVRFGTNAYYCSRCAAHVGFVR